MAFSSLSSTLTKPLALIKNSGQEQSSKDAEDTEDGSSFSSSIRWKWRTLKWKARNSSEGEEWSNPVLPTISSPTSPATPNSENQHSQMKLSTGDTLDNTSVSVKTSTPTSTETLSCTT